MKHILLIAILGTALASPVLAQSADVQWQGSIPVMVASAPPPPLYPDAPYISPTVGHWTLPSQKEANALYPPYARESEVEGYAKINCLIGKDGHLTDCEVESEMPKGYKFGEATAKLMVQSGSVDISSIPGGMNPDSRVRLEWTWWLE